MKLGSVQQDFPIWVYLFDLLFNIAISEADQWQRARSPASLLFTSLVSALFGFLDISILWLPHFLVFFQESTLQLFCLIYCNKLYGIIIIVSQQQLFGDYLKENTTYTFLSCTSQRASGIQNTLSPSAGWD